MDPIHILSLGAGVQSSTLALMAAAGEIGPMPTAAIFADTHDEPRAVYDWLAWLETKLPFPVIRVTAGSLSEDALQIRENRKTGKPYYSNRIPAFVKTAKATEGQVQRHCTRDFKIYPVIRHIRQFAEIKRGEKSVRVIQWIGISLDEAHRMKPARDPWMVNRWPLVDAGMKRHDCLRWMEARGFPTPPRSACIYCPYKSNAEWRRLRDETPEEFAAAAEFEIKLQATHAGISTPGKMQGIPFLHRSLVPLRDVDLSTDLDRGQGSLWGNECEGMCGV